MHKKLPHSASSNDASFISSSNSNKDKSSIVSLVSQFSKLPEKEQAILMSHLLRCIPPDMRALTIALSLEKAFEKKGKTT